MNVLSGKQVLELPVESLGNGARCPVAASGDTWAQFSFLPLAPASQRVAGKI